MEAEVQPPFYSFHAPHMRVTTVLQPLVISQNINTLPQTLVCTLVLQMKLACAECSYAARLVCTQHMSSFFRIQAPSQSNGYVLPVSMMPLYKSRLTSTSHFPTLSSIISAHGQHSVTASVSAWPGKGGRAEGGGAVGIGLRI